MGYALKIFVLFEKINLWYSDCLLKKKWIIKIRIRIIKIVNLRIFKTFILLRKSTFGILLAYLKKDILLKLK